MIPLPPGFTPACGRPRHRPVHAPVVCHTTRTPRLAAGTRSPFPAPDHIRDACYAAPVREEPPKCKHGHGPMCREADRSLKRGWRWRCRECKRDRGRTPEAKQRRNKRLRDRRAADPAYRERLRVRDEVRRRARGVPVKAIGQAMCVEHDVSEQKWKPSGTSGSYRCNACRREQREYHPRTARENARRRETRTLMIQHCLCQECGTLNLTGFRKCEFCREREAELARERYDPARRAQRNQVAANYYRERYRTDPEFAESERARSRMRYAAALA